ncbi:zinc ABC transporter ATP-binding protein AztA [Saccharopolyspora sp. TS4A08]|uniref:Zinc ABC transporter ATP-binding protein AztA n=1 Tax=Saccharopolyspora ipomoeae TaxID=3042027 RepID=A0ABT6PQN4_9PSEU|nr:zinc ABC transporter ATP-binding protein AztA [Saccharopolyspora sp. TS4A08]MDI2030310.1 zinc ABC transporter ATP-binding protein AztA [Saccharopolyspora sp. TS4A08]
MSIASRPAVELSRLQAGYQGKQVLDIEAAAIPAASLTAVVGPNGAGKSTLMAALAGTLTGNGALRTGYRGRPAFVPQHSAVPESLPCTAFDAVAMGRWAERGPWRKLTAADRAAIGEAMERLEITAFAHRRLGTLSGGQRQRVLVAQGLAQQAELLLLDEPDAGADPQARGLIADAIRAETRRGRAVVQVSHDLTEARRADHCLLLHRGHLHAAGHPDDVLTPTTINQVWVPS